MQHCIGIHLGEHSAQVAFCNISGSPRILRDPEGHDSTPCLVEFNGEEFFVGRGPEAKYQGGAPDVAAHFVRQMGRAGIRYPMGGRTFTPTDLGAVVLERMRRIAERQLGSIDSVAVSVPADASPSLSENVKAAAHLAGLGQVTLVPEPVAVVLDSHARTDWGSPARPRADAVCLLSRTRCTAAIVHTTFQSLQILSTNSIEGVGADVFDLALRNLVLGKAQSAIGRLHASEHPDHQAIVNAKHKLSTRPKALLDIHGEPIQVTREEFEEALSPYLSQMELLCKSVLEEAGLAAADLAGVFVAGDATRIPRVQQSVARVFGQGPVGTGESEDTVVNGVAMAAWRPDFPKDSPPLSFPESRQSSPKDLADPEVFGRPGAKKSISAPTPRSFSREKFPPPPPTETTHPPS